MRWMKKAVVTGVSLLIVAIGVRCGVEAGRAPAQGQPAIAKAILHDPASFYYIDAKNYPQGDRRGPIGVFDSGMGGLTVLDAMVGFDRYNNRDHSPAAGGDGTRDFAQERFIYLGDSANMPYGVYPELGKTDLLMEHIFKDVQFLLGQRYYRRPTDEAYQTDKSPVKVIVIACNTATAYGKNRIEGFLEQAGLDIKVIGVIDAGSRGALDVLGKEEDGGIAVMATEGTVASCGYVKALEAGKAARDYRGQMRVFQQAGVGLAGAIDGAAETISPGATAARSEYKGPGANHVQARIDLAILPRYGFDWDGNQILYKGERDNPAEIQLNSVKNYIYYHVVSLLEQVRRAPGAPKLKAIILGCTHYPFYTDVFAAKLKQLYEYQEGGKYVYRPYMAEKVILVDPAANTAAELYEYLRQKNLFNAGDLYDSEFYASAPNVLNKEVRLDAAGNFTYAYKYGRQAGRIQEYVKAVPFSRATLGAEAVERLSGKAPVVFDMVRQFNENNPKMKFLPADEKIR